MKPVEKLMIIYFRTRIAMLHLFSVKKAAEFAFRLFITPMPVKEKTNVHFPEGPQSIHFMFENKTVRGYRWGKGGRKKVMILHGFSSNLTKFLHYVQPLIDKGMEVYLFDAPAHGKSEGKTFHVLQYRDLITQAVNMYGPFDSYIAHSFGGLALSLFAEQYEMNITDKMVLIAPATETATSLQIFCEKIGIHQKVREGIKEHIYRESGKLIDYFSMRRVMHQIRSSVLWIHDLEDAITPWSDAEAVKNDNHPNIQFVNTQGMGHRRIYRDGKVTKMIISFLAEEKFDYSS